MIGSTAQNFTSRPDMITPGTQTKDYNENEKLVKNTTNFLRTVGFILKRISTFYISLGTSMFVIGSLNLRFEWDMDATPIINLAGWDFASS